MRKVIAIFSLVILSSASFGHEYFTIPLNKPKKLPFSEGVRVGNTVFLSGQIGIPPGESGLVKGGIEAETKQVMKNIGIVLNHYGLTYKDIFKCLVILADISEWKKFNKVYLEYFSAPFPARSAFASNGLAFGARVELECVAQ